MSIQPILIAGQWRPADAEKTFRAINPATGEPLEPQYPVSRWSDCEAALDAAVEAAWQLRQLPGERIAAFLEAYADQIEARREQLVETAHAETALPKSPRLADAELPRTIHQLRQAAAAAREGSWRAATIDTQNNVRSWRAPLGPVCVMGPNNFPFAFGSMSGGDFAAAIAAHNPVIGKAHSSHPATTRLFAEAALQAIHDTDLPAATVQMIYRIDHADGERLVADPRLGATGYTGSRSAGLKLKAAADQAGNPIYLEMSSINPVILLPGALRQRQDAIAAEFVQSGLMGSGQFCTSPGLVLLLRGEPTEAFLEQVAGQYNQAPTAPLLSEGVQKSLQQSVERLREAGAQLLTEATAPTAQGFCCANTLLRISGDQFLADPETFQTEAFGNASLMVVAEDVAQIERIVDQLEGNLTGCIYSDTDGSDDAAYDRLAPRLQYRVGRLLNDKMPTGVAVSPAMNHGGPYPATGHAGFTAVGIPAALQRFTQLQCFDNVRPHRLPECLQDKNPHGQMWRYIDGRWTQDDVTRS